MAGQKSKRASAAKQTGSHRSVCPLACALDVIGDKWTLLIVRDLACGKTQFKEFAASPEKIATNILTDRLGRLLEHELVEKVSPDGSTRATYRLSPRGRSLLPVLRSVADWGLANIRGTAARMTPRDI